MASARLLRVSVSRSEIPSRTVTPVNEELLLKDSTVVSISAPLMEGMKHSIFDMIISVFVYQRQI
jgi:hypothetical protein